MSKRPSKTVVSYDNGFKYRPKKPPVKQGATLEKICIKLNTTISYKSIGESLSKQLFHLGTVGRVGLVLRIANHSHQLILA